MNSYKKHFLLIVGMVSGFALTASAQKGSKYIQPSGQAVFATGDLGDIVKTGIGGAVKGIYGFSDKPQAITLEAGYNNLPVKDLPAGASANYSAIPVYAGYRVNLGGVILESQAGVSFNRIAGSGPGGKASANQTAFGWAFAAGYAYKNVELTARYQSSEGRNDVQQIRLIGARLAYNFQLK